MAITYDIGVGGDYAHLGLAWNALIATGLTQDTTLRIISSHTVTSWTLAPVLDCNGFTLRVVCDDAGYHFGNPNTGYIITRTTTTGQIAFVVDVSTPSQLIVENLNIQINASSYGNQYRISFNRLWNIGDPICTSDFTIRNIVAMSVGAAQDGGVVCDPLRSGVGAAFATVKMSNLKIISFRKSLRLQNSVYTSGDFQAENITVYNGTNDRNVIVDSKAWNSVKNIVATGGTEVFFTTSTGSNRPTLINCASSDTSISAFPNQNCLSNIVAADEFISTDPANDNYLKPSTTGQIFDMGAVPSYVTADIAGLPIPSYVSFDGVILTPELYPIGCHVHGYILNEAQEYLDLVVNTSGLTGTGAGTVLVVISADASATPQKGPQMLRVRFDASVQVTLRQL
jgi:hypothetical protein